MAVPMVWMVAIAEIIAGVALIVGAFGKEMLTRLAGVIVIVIMIGAIGMVHFKNGWNVMNGGLEFQVMTLALDSDPCFRPRGRTGSPTRSAA